MRYIQRIDPDRLVDCVAKIDVNHSMSGDKVELPDIMVASVMDVLGGDQDESFAALIRIQALVAHVNDYPETLMMFMDSNNPHLLPDELTRAAAVTRLGAIKKVFNRDALLRAAMTVLKTQGAA